MHRILLSGELKRWYKSFILYRTCKRIEKFYCSDFTNQGKFYKKDQLELFELDI